MTDCVTAFVTAGSMEEAEKIASALIEERLAACVNIIPQVFSMYRWKGKVEKDSEVKMIIKTTLDCSEVLIPRVQELHSYDVCEVTVLPILNGNPSYLDWIEENTRP